MQVIQKLLIIVVVAVLVLSGCKPKGVDVYKVVVEAHSKIPDFSKFLRIYPNAEYHIPRYRFQGKPELDSIVLTVLAPLHGRYQLVMFVKLELDGAREKIISYKTPYLMLREIKAVSPGSMTAGLPIPISGEDWITIQSHNGDLESVGIVLTKNQPATNDAVICRYVPRPPDDYLRETETDRRIRGREKNKEKNKGSRRIRGRESIRGGFDTRRQ